MYAIYTLDEKGSRLWFTGPAANQFTLTVDDVSFFDTWELALLQVTACQMVVETHLHIANWSTH